MVFAEGAVLLPFDTRITSVSFRIHRSCSDKRNHKYYIQKVKRTTLVSELYIIGVNSNGSVYYTAFIYIALEVRKRFYCQA